MTDPRKTARRSLSGQTKGRAPHKTLSRRRSGIFLCWIGALGSALCSTQIRAGRAELNHERNSIYFLFNPFCSHVRWRPRNYPYPTRGLLSSCKSIRSGQIYHSFYATLREQPRMSRRRMYERHSPRLLSICAVHGHNRGVPPSKAVCPFVSFGSFIRDGRVGERTAADMPPLPGASVPPCLAWVI